MSKKKKSRATAVVTTGRRAITGDGGNLTHVSAAKTARKRSFKRGVVKL